jgi:hypothetical protein
MTMKIKGRKWWGKNPKNSWKAWNKIGKDIRKIISCEKELDEYEKGDTEDDTWNERKV